MAEYGPDKAFDDDAGTRWATDAGTRQAWIAVDLGKPAVNRRRQDHEEFGKRVQKFELQYEDDGQWKTILDRHDDRPFLEEVPAGDGPAACG